MDVSLKYSIDIKWVNINHKSFKELLTELMKFNVEVLKNNKLYFVRHCLKSPSFLRDYYYVRPFQPEAVLSHLNSIVIIIGTLEWGNTL
jgi:hypothetical protein